MMKRKERVKAIFDYTELEKEINNYMRNQKLTFEDVAIRIGMTEGTLKRTLNNERDFFVDEINRIVMTLRIDKKKIEKCFFKVINKKEIEARDKELLKEVNKKGKK